MSRSDDLPSTKCEPELSSFFPLLTFYLPSLLFRLGNTTLGRYRFTSIHRSPPTDSLSFSPQFKVLCAFYDSFPLWLPPPWSWFDNHRLQSQAALLTTTGRRAYIDYSYELLFARPPPLFLKISCHDGAQDPVSRKTTISDTFS